MSVSITAVQDLSPAASAIEIVERKGLGHPDSICDALAEAVSISLCKYYYENFDFILHHNVDKALLLGGTSQPQCNGGHIISPMEFFLAGRATQEFRGKHIPVEELVIETRGGETRTLTRKDAPRRGEGSMLPLFSSPGTD